MDFKKHKRNAGHGLIFFIIFLFITVSNAQGQVRGMYPPFTKWYQDPLGLKPIELSSAVGFVWGSAATAACLILTKNDSTFQKKLSIYAETGYTFSYKPPYTSVFHNDVGIMYELRKWMLVGIGMNTFHFKDTINDTWTIGIMPFARWYLLKHDKLNFFFQYGAGVSYSLNRFPLTGTELEADTGRIGTKFNFLSKYGVGIVYNLSKHLTLQASINHFHLSNGNINGLQRNPSHDSDGILGGIIYKININKNYIYLTNK